jgi:hypothetical protein
LRSCGGNFIDADAFDHHCQNLGYSGPRNQYQLKMIHNDSRQCPISPDIGATVSTGALIEDLNAVYPDIGGNTDTKTVHLRVHRTDNACSDPPGDIVGQANQDFSYIDWNYDGHMDWVAQSSVSSPARTGADDAYDCPVFAVEPLTAGAPWANSKNRLNYFGTQW